LQPLWIPIYNTTRPFIPAKKFFEKSPRLWHRLAGAAYHFRSGSNIYKSPTHSYDSRKRPSENWRRYTEFKGIINYAVIGLIQLEQPADAPEEMPVNEVSTLYDKYIAVAKQLMNDKNHDYGEAWRSMSQESFVDLILMKLQRIRQILSNDGKTLISEGIDANYLDIINYAVFALILM
jgi:hypothetical protein